ncbi:AAA family ATPase [Paucimonas lemoignei]|uniref:AAA family ATPase n=1 Tax=Paucimonas lemoignei TaxID=29443 RepID=UPI00104DDEE7|nr:AAA family ATPase [Paucimonas lemoignei]
MIFALSSTKGGEGKSTLALNLAIALSLAGRDVLAVDADPQMSLASALKLREPDPIAAASYADGQTLRQQVQLAAKRYEDIVIDCPGGRNSAALRAALMVADRVVVPFQPRSYSMWAIADFLEILTEARGYRDIAALAVLSMADPRGADNREAAAAIPEGITYLPTPIGRRKAISESAAEGRSIIELPGRDPKAEVEMRNFIHAVLA